MIIAIWFFLQGIPITMQDFYYGLATLILLGGILWRVFHLSKKVKEEATKYTDEKSKELREFIIEKSKDMNENFEKAVKEIAKKHEKFDHDCAECRGKIWNEFDETEESRHDEMRKIEHKLQDVENSVKSEISSMKLQARDDRFATQMVGMQLENLTKAVSEFFTGQKIHNEKMEGKIGEIHEKVIGLSIEEKGKTK